MENQHPEALILVNDRPSAIGDDLYQWALDAEDMIRRLHTRVEELEKDRGNAKRLVSKIWNQHPEARGTIEEGTGAWLVFGQDVETSGVSAQRVTQSQPLKASSDWLIDGGLLYRLNDRGTNCDEINVTMAGGLRTEVARVERAGEILNMLKAVQQAEDHIEQPIEMVAAPGVPNLDDYYCKGCGRIGEIEELSAQDKAKLRKLDGKPKTAPVMEPVLSDVLPAIGSRVFIRHRRDNDAHACIVTGYYAWEDDGGNPMLHRVFVRLVYEGTNTSQSCILCECHPSAEAALAATPATAAQSEVPKVGSAWRHKNGNAYRVVAIANDCDAHFSERYPVTVVYQGENGKMWARRADDWHRSMTHDATAPSTAPSTAPVVLPEPDEYQYRMKPNWDDKLPWTPWEACSKESAANFRKLKEIHNWIYEVRERYTEQQVRELLAKDIDPVNLDRLGKALTKLGHAKWVSQAEAAAEIPRWVNALTSCVLEIPEAAPQPQAGALDATQILIRPAAAQKIPRDPIPTVDTWETCTIKEAKELNPALWRVRMLYPQEAIDAAIAAAKEKTE